MNIYKVIFGIAFLPAQHFFFDPSPTPVPQIVELLCFKGNAIISVLLLASPHNSSAECNG